MCHLFGDGIEHAAVGDVGVEGSGGGIVGGDGGGDGNAVASTLELGGDAGELCGVGGKTEHGVVGLVAGGEGCAGGCGVGDGLVGGVGGGIAYGGKLQHEQGRGVGEDCVVVGLGHLYGFQPHAVADEVEDVFGGFACVDAQGYEAEEDCGKEGF